MVNTKIYYIRDGEPVILTGIIRIANTDQRQIRDLGNARNIRFSYETQDGLRIKRLWIMIQDGFFPTGANKMPLAGGLFQQNQQHSRSAVHLVSHRWGTYLGLAAGKQAYVVRMWRDGPHACHCMHLYSNMPLLIQ